MSLGNFVRRGVGFLDDIRTIPQRQAQVRQDERNLRNLSLLEESRRRADEDSARQLADMRRGYVDFVEGVAPTLNSLHQSQVDAEFQRSLVQGDRTTQNVIDVTKAAGQVQEGLMGQETANRINLINNQGRIEGEMAGRFIGNDPGNPLSQQFLGYLSSEGDANRAHQLALMERANRFTMGDALGVLAPLAAAFLV